MDGKHGTEDTPVIERYTVSLHENHVHSDYEKFGLQGLTADMARLFEAVLDLCALTGVKVRVSLNDEVLNIKVRKIRRTVQLHSGQAHVRL